MKCSKCIAYGRDYISELCVAGHSIKGNCRANYHCKYSKKSIERDLAKELMERPDRYKLYRKEWDEG